MNIRVSSGPYWKSPIWIELETVGFFGKPYLALWILATLHPIMKTIMTIHGVIIGEK